jgi:hypothetical protein
MKTSLGKRHIKYIMRRVSQDEVAQIMRKVSEIAEVSPEIAEGAETRMRWMHHKANDR